MILTEDNYVDYFNDLLLNKSNTKLDSFTDEVIEDKYKDLLSKSISYMILNRCGFNPDPHYVHTDFSNISLFDNIETITVVTILNAVTTIVFIKYLPKGAIDKAVLKLLHINLSGTIVGGV